ncbi:MAG: hypothetical protein HRU19_08750 [Pseudobacteriovorax sp.]|nr:hypothetical protein [Pseudobacteriovorax sp.]
MNRLLPISVCLYPMFVSCGASEQTNANNKITVAGLSGSEEFESKRAFCGPATDAFIVGCNVFFDETENYPRFDILFPDSAGQGVSYNNFDEGIPLPTTAWNIQDNGVTIVHRLDTGTDTLIGINQWDHFENGTISFIISGTYAENPLPSSSYSDPEPGVVYISTGKIEAVFQDAYIPIFETEQ